MAFANEVRDFIDAFQVGAKVKDAYKRRKHDETAEENRVKIAQAKQDYDREKFDKVYGQNERKLKGAEDRWRADYGLREQAAARQAADSASMRKQREETAKRLAAQDADKARKARIAADPTSEFADEPALPTNVTPQPQAEGIPVSNEAAASAPAQAKSALPSAATAALASAPAAAATAVGIAPGATAKALAGGMKYLQEHFGLNAALPGEGAATKDGVRRLFEGEGSMTPEEEAQIEKVLDEDDIANGVDPKSLSRGMRKLRMLTKTYNELNYVGRTKEANQMAAGIIQTSRGIASMLGQSAIKKLESGDIKGAATDVVSAHDQIPDGRSVAFDPESMTFVVKDEETGEEIEKGQVTPDMIWSVANGFKDGSATYSAIAAAAARDPSMKDPKAAAESGAKEEPGLKPMGQEDLGEDAMGEVGASIQNELMAMELPDGSKVFDAADPTQIEQQIGPEALTAVKDLGVMIAHYNGLRPEKAGKLALSLVNPDLTNPEKPDFNFKMINGDQNTMEIMAEDGTRLRLPARTATAMIKRGWDGLTAFAQNMNSSHEEAEIGSAIRDARTGEMEDEIAASAKRAKEKAALDVFDREVLESVHGPGGTEANTVVSALPITKVKPKPQRRLARK